MVFKTNWCLKWFHHWLTYCLIYLMVFKFKPMNIQQNIQYKFEKRMGVPASFFPKQVRKWMEIWTEHGSLTNQKLRNIRLLLQFLQNFRDSIQDFGKKTGVCQKAKKQRRWFFRIWATKHSAGWLTNSSGDLGNKRLLESSENPLRSKMNWELSIHVCNLDQREGATKSSDQTWPDQKQATRKSGCKGCQHMDANSKRRDTNTEIWSSLQQS